MPAVFAQQTAGPLVQLVDPCACCIETRDRRIRRHAARLVTAGHLADDLDVALDVEDVVLHLEGQSHVGAKSGQRVVLAGVQGRAAARGQAVRASR